LAAGDIGTVLDTLEFDTSKAEFIRILRRTSTIAVIFYADIGSNQKLVTVEVSKQGAITDAVKDTCSFNGAWAGYLSMAWRATGSLVLAGRMNLNGGAYNTWAATVSVGEAGQLPSSPVDTLQIGTTYTGSSGLVHLQGGVLLLSYTESDSHGYLATFACTPAGSLPALVTDTYEFEDGVTDHHHLIKVSDTIVALVYKDASGDGWLKTFQVSTGGIITASALDSLEFEPDTCYRPHIVHLLGDVYVVAWADASTYGQIITISIDSSGNIGAVPLDSWQYATPRATGPAMAKLSDSVIILKYADNTPDAVVTTITIAADGTITKTPIDTLIYATSPASYTQICHMIGNIYLFPYSGAGNDGFVKSIAIETPSQALPHQIMMMGMG
jgi:hypothetical protein